MEQRTYILQKDIQSPLAIIKSGSVFKPVSDYEYPAYENGKYVLPYNYVENNPKWFIPAEPQSNKVYTEYSDKEWEILTCYVNNPNLTHDYIAASNKNIISNCETEKCNIFSVRRASDNTVWTVGDKTVYGALSMALNSQPQVRETTIDSFKITDGKMVAYGKDGFFIAPLSNLSKPRPTETPETKCVFNEEALNKRLCQLCELERVFNDARQIDLVKNEFKYKSFQEYGSQQPIGELYKPLPITDTWTNSEVVDFTNFFLNNNGEAQELISKYKESKKKLPERKVLFITSDGVGYTDIRHRFVCSVSESGLMGINSVYDAMNMPTMKHFSTKEKAIEYLTYSLPLLSLNDIISILGNGEYKEDYPVFKRALQLVENKLNNK